MARDLPDELSRFDRSMSSALKETIVQALRDYQLGNRKMRVFSAPTGSGKSSLTYAAIKALHDTHADSSMALLVNTLDQAEEAYRELRALLGDDGDLCVWTSGHDAETDEPILSGRWEGRAYSGPSQVSRRDELSSHRVIVATHNQWGLNTDLVWKYKGKPRWLTIVDECPNDVQGYEIGSGDVLKMRDDVARMLGEDHPWVEPLKEIHERMEHYWTEVLGEESYQLRPTHHQDTILVTDLNAYHLGLDDTLAGFIPALHRRQELKNLPEDWVDDVFGFIRAAWNGFAFVARDRTCDCRDGGPRFVGYRPIFPVKPGMVLLDATADIDGVNQIVGYREPAPVPHATFEKLTIMHEEPPAGVFPKGMTRVSAILQKASTAKPYADWMMRTILKHTQPGQKVLAVTHKRMRERYPHLIENGKLDGPTSGAFNIDLEGRRLSWTHFGQGIGSNAWKDAEAVFLFEEHHLPKSAIVARTLGLKSIAATHHSLDEAQGRLGGPFGIIQEGHLLRWIKQLALRGKGRFIDDSGVCGEQLLVCTGEFGRLLANQERLFPGSPPIQINRPTDDEGTQGRKRGEAALIDLLIDADALELTFREIKAQTGVDLAKHGSRYLRKPSVIAAMSSRSWKINRARGRGNLSNLSRGE